MNKEYELVGAKEVMDALSTLPADLQRDIFKKLLAKEEREFVVNPLKAALNYSDKTMKTIKVTYEPRNPLKVSGGVSRKGFHLRWADLGTKERHTKTGRNTGQIEGKHQIQPIIEEAPDKIVQDVNEELGASIQTIMERKLRKIQKKISNL